MHSRRTPFAQNGLSLLSLSKQRLFDFPLTVRAPGNLIEPPGLFITLSPGRPGESHSRRTLSPRIPLNADQHDAESEYLTGALHALPYFRRAHLCLVNSPL